MMKRWTLRISPRRAAVRGLLLLILGAVTTVTVAWGCALFSSRTGVITETDPDWMRIDFSGVGVHEWHYLPKGQTEPGGRVLAGFPFLALAGYAAPPPPPSPDGFLRMPAESAIPFFPLWPGFVIDTLFYAAIWGGVIFGFASAKRAIRRKRGRCPRCGYDLRGGVISDKRLAISGEGETSTAGCPECGWNRGENTA